MAGSVGTDNSVLVALASPVANLLGVPASTREQIPKLMASKDLTYRAALEQQAVADSELSSIRQKLQKQGAIIKTRLKEHRQKMPGLISRLER